MNVGGAAEQIDDLERRGLLPFDAHGVDAVDEFNGVVLREGSCDVEAVVEVAVELQDCGAVHDRLCELAHRDLALRDEHAARHSGLGGIGRGTRRRVACRCTDDSLGPALSRHRDRHGHAAVLERTRGVGALELQPHLAAGHLGQRAGIHKRRATLAQGHHGCLIGDRKAIAVLLDEAAPLMCHCYSPDSPSTRMTPRTSRTASRLLS